jgi:HlyD family secretion protein
MTLVSGITVDSFIQTGSRSPFSYMIQPLSEQIDRAWRER